MGSRVNDTEIPIGRRTSAALPAISWLIIVLCGCTVGPDFSRPPTTADQNYTASPTPTVMASSAGEADQRIHIGQTIQATWWDLFKSPALSEVLSQAIAGSKTIEAARATLLQAQENVRAAQGSFFPQVDAAAAAEEHQATGGGLLSGGSANLFTIGATVSYAVDVFGGTRRAVEQQEALADLQNYELAAAYLTLTGNAVGEVISIASLRAQIQATQDVIASDEQNLALVRRSFEAGKVAKTDVLTAETQLDGDRTLLPPLRQQLESARHALTVLVGRTPADWSPPDFDLSEITLPADLPLSLPSELARQRPDILATEAQLHADSAAIGVATAQLYPSINLTAALGQQAVDSGATFSAASTVWSLSAGLTAPIFHGGTLQAQKRAAVDAYQASLATYQQTVLQGLQQVADGLDALSQDAELIDSERRVYDTASASLNLQRLSYAAGKSDLLFLLNAQRAYQQARIGYLRAQAQRLGDSALLLVALGGGWWQAKI
jgi:NodT family efflux transporter outer membrane factor (OMF) lipoprotein